MKRATRFPLKPERLTGLPSRAGRVKSGTSEPMRSVSVVMCGSFLAGIRGLGLRIIVARWWRGCRTYAGLRGGIVSDVMSSSKAKTDQLLWKYAKTNPISFGRLRTGPSTGSGQEFEG